MNPKKNSEKKESKTIAKRKTKSNENDQTQITLKRLTRRERIKAKTKGFWVWSKYFFMKWRFRLDQARAIFGLITFAVLLANSYVGKIPWFKDQGFWRGDFLLSMIILFIFMIGGYVYDRIFRLWSETNIVNIERNPYSFVPAPKEYILNPAYYGYIFSALSKIAKKLDIKLEGEELLRTHLKEYYQLTPDTKDFEQESDKLIKLGIWLMNDFIESGKAKDLGEALDLISNQALNQKYSFPDVSDKKAVDIEEKEQDKEEEE